MAAIQIPSKNSAFKAYNKSPVVDTMVMERVLQGNIQNLSEGMNRSPTIGLMVEESRKRLGEGEDQRVLEGVTHKRKTSDLKLLSEGINKSTTIGTMVDEVMRLCEREDESILQGNALRLESSDAKGLSEKTKGDTGIHDKCEMIKAESGFSRADLKGGFNLPSWGCPNKRTRVKLVRTASEDESRKVCVVESKTRDSSGCLKIEGGERGKETVEKARHVENENKKKTVIKETGNEGNDTATKVALSTGHSENVNKKKQAIAMASNDDNNNTGTKAALRTRHLENEKNKNYMNIPISSTTISSNIVAPRRIEFLFEKTLFQSDVNSLNRLLIPRRFAEAYLPRLKIAKGKYRKETLLLFDHQNIAWEMKFEFWESSQSYVLTRGWRAFVNHYELRPDFLIRFYKLDQSVNKKHYGIEYVIRVPMKTIRLFGQDYPYLCLDVINGGGFCGQASSTNGGGGSSSGQNNGVIGQGKVEGAAMEEDTESIKSTLEIIFIQVFIQIVAAEITQAVNVNDCTYLLVKQGPEVISDVAPLMEM